MADLEAAVKEIREYEDEQKRLYALEHPQEGHVIGARSKPGLWRMVETVAHGEVTYLYFGGMRTVSHDDWCKWLRFSHAELIAE